MANKAPISVQLYSLREALNEDFEGTIRKLADIGYIGVEPFGGLPTEPEKAARLFNELGLKVESSHLFMPLGDDKQRGIDLAATYGIKHYIIPWQPPERFSSVDGIKALTDEINEANEAVKAAGMTLHYHNHDFEFQQVDGKIAYDIFLEHLSPDVKVQVDTYWVTTGGTDVVELVKRLGDRAPLLHIKDGPAKRGVPMTAVGEGVMDIPAIIEAAADTAQWLIVELDACATDMMEAVEKSYTYLITKGLARGNKA